MSRYANVLQSLNEIPNLTVLSNGAVFFEGNQNIKILIDGVEATIQEIQTLSKEDISKIDVYQNPPLRFLSQGVSAVLDIKLKSKIYGGNGGLDLSQAFQSLKGNNSVALYYNYRQSRFSLLYNNENAHYRKFRKSKVLNYEYDGVAVNNLRSDYKTHLDAIFSEIQYQLPDNKLGSFTIVAFETYKHSKYVDTLTPFSQTTNVMGGAVQWLGMKGPVHWWLSLGVNRYHTVSTILENPHNLCIPSLHVNIYWRVSRNVQFILDYFYSGDVPTIAQLSETNQWIDTKLVYHGNSTLKPYKTHTASLRFIYNNNYLNSSLSASFNSSPNRICDMYTLTNDYMLQTLVNLTS